MSVLDFLGLKILKNGLFIIFGLKRSPLGIFSALKFDKVQGEPLFFVIVFPPTSGIYAPTFLCKNLRFHKFPTSVGVA